jgi:hypothetical protein
MYRPLLLYMLNYPNYSDLANVGWDTRNHWDHHLSQLSVFYKYFSGAIFDEKVQLETQADEETPLLYPVGLNLVRMLCLAQADALFGAWEEEIIRFSAPSDEDPTASDKLGIAVLQDILHSSDAETLLWELALDGNIYGGSALKITPALNWPGHVRWSRVPLGGFFPIWDPDDPNDLLEVYYIVEMSKEQAEAKYGVKTTRDVALRVEHWTKTTYENKIEDQRIEAYSGKNPWGIVPFVYIPRMRTTQWWGDSMTEDTMDAQDEMNMRVADMGEAINYNSHPTRWGYNLPRTFNADNYPLGSNVMWDMGKVIGDSPPPHVDILESQNPVPDGAFKYVDFLYDWVRTSNFAPPIAFGEDEGGSQRSGATLEIRMWPLMRQIMRSRSYFTAGLSRAAYISGLILKQKGLQPRAAEAILKRRLRPSYAEILPRDHAAIVDEIVKLGSMMPPQISLETAQEALGRGSGEVDRIRALLNDPDLGEYYEPVQPFEQGGGFNPADTKPTAEPDKKVKAKPEA